MNNLSVGEKIAQSYLRKSDGTLFDRYRTIAKGAVAFLPDLYESDKSVLEDAFYESFCQKWLCLATPILTNAFREDKYGLPISCYVIRPDDSIYSISQAISEMSSLTQYGGGVGIDLTNIRQLGSPFGPEGENWKTNGARPWARLFATAAEEVSQGTNRRGAVSIWVSIEGENFWQLMRSINETTAGSDPAQFLKCNVGVIIPTGFMEKAKTPESDEFVRFKALLSSRMAIGHPYIQFQDNMDASMPDFMKSKGRKYSASNICTEIHSDADSDYTMVCCLSSLNLSKYFSWQFKSYETKEFGYVNLPGLATLLLEAVLNNFTTAIESDQFMGFEKAYNHVIDNRAIGIGQLGLAELFMQANLPYESYDARLMSTDIARFIHDESGNMSAKLAQKYGVPYFCDNFRHNRRTAIAPTITTSAIAETTPNKEPIFKNAFQDGRGKKATIWSNSHLIEYLTRFGHNVSEVMESVLQNDGSVQHLPNSILPEPKKELYRTSFEMDPLYIAQMDIERVPYLTQGQSNNYNLPHDTSLSTLFKLHYALWRGGVTTAYYIRSNSQVKKFALEQSSLAIADKSLEDADCGCDG